MTESLTRRRALALALAALAAPGRADAGLAALFAAPGVHALMRHATAPGTGDPPGFSLADPASQRRLDDRGRAEARAAGAAFRAAGVRFDHVLSSGWDRCLETARLMDLGPVRRAPSLDSFFANRAEGPARTEATLAMLRALAEGERALMVTHQVNITALTGIVPASGEILAARLSGDGLAVVGRFGPVRAA